MSESSDIIYFKNKLAQAESRNDLPLVEKIKLQIELLEKSRAICLLKIEYDALAEKYYLLYS